MNKENKWSQIFFITEHGDLGVDLFFVLSGFLISFILMKECKKYNGKIDYLHFIRSRYLRLAPMIYVMMVCAAGYFLYEGKQMRALWTLTWGTFTNNFI